MSTSHPEEYHHPASGSLAARLLIAGLGDDTDGQVELPTLGAKKTEEGLKIVLKRGQTLYMCWRREALSGQLRHQL